MVTRRQLIARWREGLERSEAEAKLASPYRRWIKRIHARVFRFLLAVYGGADWRASGQQDDSGVADHDEIADGGHSAEWIDLRTDSQGAPPKDPARIRRTLQAVHDAGPATESGPYGEGLGPDDWVVVASQRDGAPMDACAAVLAKSEIPYRRGRLGRDTVVEVRARDKDDALKLLEELGHVPRRSPGRPNRRRHAIFWVLLGVWLGSQIGAVVPMLTAGLSPDPDAIPLPDLLINTGVCYFLGGVLGGLLGYSHATYWK
jgi:hypothetical protein